VDFRYSQERRKNRKIRRPGADFRDVASRHHAIDLVQVVQVVHRPRSERVAQCHDVEGSVRACAVDEVSDGIERTSVFRIILAVNPRLRQVLELVVQGDVLSVI
jgi:hypothetical protein